MDKKTLRDIDIKGKKVIVRVDFNVPQSDDGQITDDNRIQAALSTIKYLVDNSAKVILCSHLGRPKGKVDDKFSLKPCVVRLSELLGMDVQLAGDVVGESAVKMAAQLASGQVMMLENVRFESGEEKNDAELSKKLANLAEVYVNDAFGTAHRAHASTAGIAEFLPSAMGFLIEKEVRIMGKALENPERPFMSILGGAKVKDKIGVIRNLLDKVDVLLIGGGMSYTFKKALGHNIGNSLLDVESIDFAKQMMELAEKKGVKLILPVDNEAGREFSNDTEKKTFQSEISDGWQGLDIGPETRKLFTEEISKARTVIWNGTMGVSEFSNFAAGTEAVAKALSELSGTTIIGGGDTAGAVEQLGFADKMTHVSTGGGASLEFLEGIVLPGIAVLSDK